MDLITFARHCGLDELLDCQDGVLRRDQAIAIGLSRTRIDDLLRRKRWARLLPGVYLTGQQPTARQRIRAGWLWAGPESTIAGAAAAFWNAQARREPLLVDVAIGPARRLSPQPGYRILRSAIPGQDWRWLDDLRVTTPARTCLDLARENSDHRAEHGLRRGLFTVELMNRSLVRSRNRRGQAAAVALVRDLVAGPWSRMESVAHCHLRDAGVVGWVANLRVVVDGMTQFIDIAFEDVKLAVEIDGFEVHSARAAHGRDLQRQNRLVAAGWTVLRFTWDDLRDPAAFVATVLRVRDRLLAERSARA